MVTTGFPGTDDFQISTLAAKSDASRSTTRFAAAFAQKLVTELKVHFDGSKRCTVKDTYTQHTNTTLLESSLFN